jgi:hypothetical protein
MRRVFWSLTLLCGLACGCSNPSNDTKIFVVVWSDLAVPAQIDNIVVEVKGPSGEFSVARTLTAGNEAGETKLPVVVVLVPPDNKGIPIEVTASGNSGRNVVVSQSARLAFLSGQSRVLTFFLARACQNQACGTNTTCSYGRCDRPIDVVPGNLPAYNPSTLLTPPDAGLAPTFDGSPSSSADSGTDTADEAQGNDGATDNAADVPAILSDGGRDADGEGGSAGVDGASATGEAGSDSGSGGADGSDGPGDAGSAGEAGGMGGAVVDGGSDGTGTGGSGGAGGIAGTGGTDTGGSGGTGGSNVPDGASDANETGGSIGTGGTVGSGGIGAGGTVGSGGIGTGGTVGSGGTGTGGLGGSVGTGGASDPSMVGYWSFDEPVAGSYADAWGSNNATGVGTTVIPSGAWGNAVGLGTALTNPATKYVSLPTNVDAITSTYTVSVWFNPRDFGNANSSQALVTWDGGGTDGSSCKGFRLVVIPPLHLTADANCGSAGYAAATAPLNSVQGRWSLVVVTIAGRTWTLHLYNQGACNNEVPNFPKASNLSFPGFAPGGTWRMGASGTDTQDGFNGSLDELHLWSRTLSLTEIRNLCTCNQTSCP